MSAWRTASPFDQLTPGVRGLLIANVAVYFVMLIFPGFPVNLFGLVPLEVIRHYYVWQLVTYAFIHGGGWHLFFNMFALWMVGPAVEGVWGTPRFLRFYFACVLGAALTQAAIAPNVMVLGASGAIYGLLAAFAVIFPDAVILLFVFPARAPQAVMFIGLMTLVFAISDGGTRVAHLAHLGGLVTGYLILKMPEWAEWLRLRRAQYRFEHPKGRRRVIPSPSEDLSKEVDRILEKISSQGVDSLSGEEHRTMERYAQLKH